MRQLIFNHHINEFRTYLFIPQRVLHCVLWSKRENIVTLPHSAQRKNAFLGEIKEMSKKEKLQSRKKIALELLHQRLGHRSTISLLDGDTANVWEDFELRINTDPFCTSCQISSIKKRLGLKFH